MKKSILVFVILSWVFVFETQASNYFVQKELVSEQVQEGVVIINKRKSGEYIGETSGRAMTMKVYKTTGNTKILWSLEDAGGGYVRLKNLGSGKYLHCENGGLQIGDIEQGWQSAQWRIEKKDGYVRIQNRFKGFYLNNQNEILELSKMKKKGGDSSLWKIRNP
ncbi:MAG: RICIN domain-containing protein [Reichenbachiella sp.]